MMGTDAEPDILAEYYAEDPRLLSDAARNRLAAETGRTRAEVDADIEAAGYAFDHLDPDEPTREALGFPPVPKG